MRNNKDIIKYLLFAFVLLDFLYKVVFIIKISLVSIVFFSGRGILYRVRAPAAGITSLFSRFQKPIEGFCVIFRYTFSLIIADSQIKLGFCISLFSRFPKPIDGFYVILCHASAVFIADSQIKLSFCISSFSRFPPPIDGFCIISRYTLSHIIADSQIK